MDSETASASAACRMEAATSTPVPPFALSDGETMCSPEPLSPAGEGPALGLTATKSPSAASAMQHFAAPSPNTMVVLSRLGAPHAPEQVRAREAALSFEHAIEVARLNQAICDVQRAQAAEINHLRAQHAGEIRKLVEALWYTQDIARAALTSLERAESSPSSERQTGSSPERHARATNIVIGVERLRCTTTRLMMQAARLWPSVLRAWR